jgi:hypothetical protein
MDPIDFSNPSPSHQITPFWFWNGAINREEISRQLREMKNQGICSYLPAGTSVFMNVPKSWSTESHWVCERGRPTVGWDTARF